MSRSKLNIEELEKKFDQILSSMDDDKTEEWLRYDEEQLQLEKISKGIFTSVTTISGCQISKPSKMSKFKAEIFELTEGEYNIAS